MIDAAKDKDSAWTALGNAKSEYKALVKVHDKAVDDRERFLNSFLEERPLFPASQAPAPTPATPPVEGDWRALSTGVLDLTGQQRDALTDRQILTLGALADFLEEDGFRGLTAQTAGDSDGDWLDYRAAAEVLAAYRVWWDDNRGGPLPFADADNCPADRDMIASLVDWRRRQESGDDAPKWGRWSEFEVTLEDGERVEVTYDGNRDKVFAGMIELRGPVSSTGYRCEFPRAVVADAESLQEYATNPARQLAEDLKKPAKAKSRGKGKAKAAQEADADPFP